MRPARERNALFFRAAALDPAAHIVAIGASTGGPQALLELLAHAPADFPPVAIVQHMPAGFTKKFAERLDRFSAMTVAEAVEGEPLTPGRALLARGDTQLTVRRAGQAWEVHYTHQQLYNLHCPSVDVLFTSVAETAGARAVGVLLTGMGADGARGLSRLRQAGALTIAQDRDSCAIYGMPKAAVELGAVQFHGSPADIPEIVRRELACRRAQTAVVPLA